MELTEFINEVRQRLTALEFVEDISVEKLMQTAVKIKVTLKPKGYLNIWYNVFRRTQSFNLLINDVRIWGIDHDNRFGWHEHRLDNPQGHQKIDAMTISEIIAKLYDIWYSGII